LDDANSPCEHLLQPTKTKNLPTNVQTLLNFILNKEIDHTPLPEPSQTLENNKNSQNIKEQTIPHNQGIPTPYIWTEMGTF